MGGIYVGIVKTVAADGRVFVSIPKLGNTIGPLRVANSNTNSPLLIDEQVLCAFTSMSNDEMYVLGYINARDIFTPDLTTPSIGQILSYNGTEWVNDSVLSASTTAITQSPGNNTTAIATTAFVTQAVPVGVINPYAGSTAPSGWLLCFGQAVSRTTYAALFAVLSTTYNTGVVAGTDFCLPDLRGRAVAGVDNMGGTDAARLSIANTLGTTTGTETVTLTTAEIPAHAHANTLTNNSVTSGAMSANSTLSHSITDPNHHHTETSSVTGTVTTAYASGSNSFLNTGSITVDTTSAATGISIASHTVSHDHTVTSNVTISNVNAGGGGAHNNMPPTMVLNYIIKAL